MPKERQTCTACSMRRQKCDRQSPCSRCVKRGEADRCTREWGPEGYDPTRHRVYPRPNDKAKGSPASQYHSDNASGTSPSSEPNRRLSALSTPATDSAEAALHPSLRTSDPSARDPNPNKVANSAGGDATDVKVLDFLAWGKTPLANLGISSVELRGDLNGGMKDPTTDWNYSNGFGGTGSAQMSFLQLLLPGRRQITQLVDYHLTSVTWYHSAVHSPTFDRELKEHYAKTGGLQIRDMDLRWAALLFSIMAASMTCAPEKLTTSWGFHRTERAKLTRQWFKATLSCLNLADYMWRHHIYSVQAIATLTMCAHILGFSNTQSTLMGAALKIAQGLGLQRLGPEEEIASTAPGQQEKLVRRETGRRVWYQLCIQDWFSIPFSEMYSIQKHHFSTIPPQNVNDETMAPLPANVPSMSCFGNNLQQLARLMADSHDAVMTSSTLLTKYDQVLHFESKIRKWLADLPTYLKVGEKIEPGWPHWLPWARRSLLMCFAHKIVMIHRNFLGRSFSEPAFAHTREACMVAAKTILREAKLVHEEEGPVLWIDQAFMVAAGITLSLDIFHRKPADAEYMEHRKLVENNISMLSKFEDSMIAARGTKLLSSLLTEQARSAATQSLDNYRSKRHRENDVNHPSATTSVFATGQPQTKRQRQKFDVPRFVESLGNTESFTNSLRKPTNDQENTASHITPDLFGTTGSSHATEQSGVANNKAATSPSILNVSNTSTTPMAPLASFSSTIGTTLPTSQAPNFSPESAERSQDRQIQQSQPSPGNNNNNNNTNGASFEQFQVPGNMDFGYETFEQLFPPQTGISNSFLFEDLLNFDF